MLEQYRNLFFSIKELHKSGYQGLRIMPFSRGRNLESCRAYIGPTSWFSMLDGALVPSSLRGRTAIKYQLSSQKKDYGIIDMFKESRGIRNASRPEAMNERINKDYQDWLQASKIKDIMYAEWLNGLCSVMTENEKLAPFRDFEESTRPELSIIYLIEITGRRMSYNGLTYAAPPPGKCHSYGKNTCDENHAYTGQHVSQSENYLIWPANNNKTETYIDTEDE